MIQLVPHNQSRSIEEVLAMLKGPAEVPFSPAVVDFCTAFSRALFADERCRRLGDIQALAFRLRKAELTRLEEDFRRNAPCGILRRPRGLVFHVAPANVDTMFVYSWLFSALMGNRNLIRLSTSASETALLLCEIANQVIGARHSAAVIQYGHDEAITAAISAVCDTRVIWGGDDTVRVIRAVPLAARATEVVFADRYSFSIIAAHSYLALPTAERARLADQFFNDAFWFDQMACSSPRLLVWLGIARRIAPGLARIPRRTRAHCSAQELRRRNRHENQPPDVRLPRRVRWPGNHNRTA